MNRGTRRRRAAVAIVLLAVLTAALPAATAFHDHHQAEHPETECEICAVATASVAVVRDGSALSVRADRPSLPVVEAFAEVAPPTLRANGARAPPA